MSKPAAKSPTNWMCTREQCPIYKLCTNPAINRTLQPCGPVHQSANNLHNGTEIPLEHDRDDTRVLRDYREVLNELSAGMARKAGLPSVRTAQGLRALLCAALLDAHYPPTIISEVLHVSRAHVYRLPTTRHNETDFEGD